MPIFLPFHWPRAPYMSCKLKLPTNNGVLMRNVVQLFLAANTILLMCKWNHACSLLVYVISVITPGRQRANRFPKILFIKKQTQWSNDKTIIELSYRQISWFVSVSQINYFASAFSFGKSRYFTQPRPIIANYYHDGFTVESNWYPFFLTAQFKCNGWSIGCIWHEVITVTCSRWTRVWFKEATFCFATILCGELSTDGKC